MSIRVYCNKCDSLINAIDPAMLIRYDTLTSWFFRTLNYNANQMLENGENAILCKNCSEKFLEFLKGAENND